MKVLDYSEENLKTLNHKSWEQDITNLNGHKRIFTAYIAKEGNWWIGWVQGVAGVNCMERTKKKLLDSLKEELPEMLELNPDVYIDDDPEPHFRSVRIEL